MEKALTKEKIKTIFWILFIAIFIFFVLIRPLISRFYGAKEIDSFFEANRPYKATYWVYLFSDEESSKNYKLPADIIVNEECFDFGNGDNNEVECESFIELERAYFNNGGNISFGDCHIESGNVSCVDKNGKNWKIEFRGEKVK